MMSQAADHAADRGSRSKADDSLIDAASQADEPEFSIRELCDAFDVTPRALRFYESQELIMPQRDGQRRIYSLRDRARLKLILRGKRFGFSLAEIRELLDLYELGDQQVTQLSRTLSTAHGKLDELKLRREELDAVIDDLEAQIGLVKKMLTERREADARG